MPDESLPLTVADLGRASVVRFTTTSLLDEDEVFGLGDGLLDLADEVGKKPLIVNLNGFDFYRSMFLATMLRVLERRQHVGGRLILVQAPDSFSQQTFEVTGVARKFEIHRDEEAALASI
jgi:anti-anti-sigma factor